MTNLAFNVGGLLNGMSLTRVSSFLNRLSLTDTPVTAEDIKTILSSLQGQISVETVVSVLVVIVGACVGLAFMWWGVRKIIAAVMTAFQKGKISI